MPSPFPGMDPYIEGWIWGDFHSRLIPAVFDQLVTKLPERYIASTELFVWRVEEDDAARSLLGGPDIHVKAIDPALSATNVSIASAPYVTTLASVERRQKYISIVDAAERREVTVIECLSPANKTRGDDGNAYRAKREEYLANRINLVEIDLLRGGVRPPLGEPQPPITDYYLLVCRSETSSKFGVWPFSLRDPIPPLLVPLDPDVHDITIDLRACIDHVYDAGRYGRQLEYDRPPRPPLHHVDAAWARELLAAKLTANGTGA